MKYLSLIFLSYSFIFTNAQIHNKVELNLDSLFQNNKGSFVLYDLQEDQYFVYNENIATMPFSVHSTSKILWSIIGLEENLVEATDIFYWDSIKYPRNNSFLTMHYKDHTVVSALHYSVNWFYIELLNKMPPSMIEKYLNSLPYQEGFKVEKINYFGLTYQMKKTAFEQISFLKLLFLNKASIKQETYTAIKQGMLAEENAKYKHYCRTGLGPINDNESIGWKIGVIEKQDKLFFYAFNLIGEDELKAWKMRDTKSLEILKYLNLIK